MKLIVLKFTKVAGMKLELVKILVLIALFVLTFLLGIVPIFILKFFSNRSENLHRKILYKRTLSFLTCFAAGVFLATGLLDLLPSARVHLASVLNSLEIFTSFPLAEFVMMFGFFIILIVEQVVLTIKERNLSVASGVTSPLLQHSTNGLDEVRSHFMASDHSIVGISDEPTRSGHFACSVSQKHDHENQVLHSEDDEEVDVITAANLSPPDSCRAHEHSSLRSLLLIAALSLHSVFEGLAVGLQKNPDDVLGIFAALVLHKTILSFSLGMNLIQSKLSRAGVIRSIIFFSLTAPVGVAVGIGVMDLWDSTTSTLVQGILTGAACGTFLFVTFFEVLPCEFNSEDQRLLKIVLLLVGFSTVTAILLLHNDKGPICYIIPGDK